MKKILLLGTVLFVGLSGCQHLIPNQEHQISITKPLGTTQGLSALIQIQIQN